MSNRYPDMIPVDVIEGPAYLPNHIYCPVCNTLTYASGLGGEVGYHGSNNGAHLCKGSGYKINNILEAA